MSSTTASASTVSPPCTIAAFLLPREVWDLILNSLPENCLANVARASKFLRDKVASPDHWRLRLRQRGLLSLFEKHPARNLFQQGDVVKWREYYRHYCAIYSPRSDLQPEEMCGEETLTFIAGPPGALSQFPGLINQPGTKIISASVSEPYFATYSERQSHDGSEGGDFQLADGRWVHCYHLRIEINSAENNWLTNESFEAPTFRAFKSKYYLSLERCPFKLSYADYVHHLLDVIVEDKKYKRPIFVSAYLEPYRAKLAMLQPRRITVKFSDAMYVAIPFVFCIRRLSLNHRTGTLSGTFQVTYDLTVMFRAMTEFFRLDPAHYKPPLNVYSASYSKMTLISPMECDHP